jgi:replicative DNA helicase
VVPIPDNELRLVSKAIRESDIKPVIERGITTDWFVNDEARQMWSFILEHWSKYGVVPAPATIRDVMPGCTLLEVTESYTYLIDTFVDWRKRGLTVQMLQQAVADVEGEDHEKAVQDLRKSMADIELLNLNPSGDRDLTQNVIDRIAEYKELKNLPGGMRGISTGFPTIDRATMGLQGGQLITIIATPKAGKSTLTLKLADNINKAGHPTALVTFEMSIDEQEARFDAMVSKVMHAKLLSGQIDQFDEITLERELAKLELRKPFWVVQDPAANTISGLCSKIERLEPDVLFVDGTYLMLDEISGEQNTPQALRNITRNLKRTAQRYDIPIVNSTQALTWKVNKKKGITSESIGYSSSFFEDSDTILGLDWTDEDHDPDERTLKVVDARNCPRIEVTVSWDWRSMDFTELDDD